MLFNSFDFALFLPIVFGLYWALQKYELKYQNLLLLGASYFFYGCWDWRFLSLIAFSSFVDYWVGLKLGTEKNQQKRRWLLGISLAVNLGFLGFFKYFNFFAESFADAFTLLGVPFEATRLNFILPVGISFYTFQTLSYSIDIFNRKIKPTKDIISFFAFVSFFPQLVAGPIERASNLLPQFFEKRKFTYKKAVDGVQQITWGLFKKVVIADNCAAHVNAIFENYEAYSGPTLIIGGIYFALQIYCDFSGYSDIAIGTARLFGFNLMQNFNYPYFSTSMTEMWRKWHISLSTWTNDYIFRPVMLKIGNKGRIGIIASLMVTFLALGLWHGANWTFVIFGLLHGTVVSTEFYLQKHLRIFNRKINNRYISKIGGWAITMSLWLVGCIFFRAETVTQAFNYLYELFTSLEFTIPHLHRRITYLSIFFLILVEWNCRYKLHPLENLKIKKPYRWIAYTFLVYSIYLFNGEQQQFIYFQF